MQGAQVSCAWMSRVSGMGEKSSGIGLTAERCNEVVAASAEELTRALSGRVGSIEAADPGRRSLCELALGWYTAAHWAGRPSLKGWRETAPGRRNATLDNQPTKDETHPEKARGKTRGLHTGESKS